MLLLPAILFFGIFSLWPIIRAFTMSLYFIRGEDIRFIGLSNYSRLLHDVIFWKSIGNMLFILIIQVPLMIIFAMVLATLLNQKFLRFCSGFRLGIFLPSITSLVAYTIIFSMLLAQDGLINKMLNSLGLASIPWLDQSFWARISLVIALTWRWTGYNMVIFLAALQAIPKSIYEASAIDGTPTITEFLQITVPMLKPVILFTAVLSINGTLQLFDEPFNLTAGGPNDTTISPVMYIYNNAFYLFNFGYAATVSYALVLIITAFSAIQFRLIREK